MLAIEAATIPCRDSFIFTKGSEFVNQKFANGLKQIPQDLHTDMHET